MDKEYKENFDEKLRLTIKKLISDLNDDYKLMLREHSRDGLLGSGNTIKRTMGFIENRNSEIYREVLAHLDTLNIKYYANLEKDIQSIAGEAQVEFKTAALDTFMKSTEMANNPKLYERLLPEVEQSMATSFAEFQNSLNAAVLNIKNATTTPPIAKALWVLEAVLLLAAAMIAGMWYQNPQGNYEPVLVGLGLIIPLTAVAIRLCSKNET